MGDNSTVKVIESIILNETYTRDQVAKLVIPLILVTGSSIPPQYDRINREDYKLRKYEKKLQKKAGCCFSFLCCCCKNSEICQKICTYFSMLIGFVFLVRLIIVLFTSLMNTV